jgi:hypothetical protein
MAMHARAALMVAPFPLFLFMQLPLQTDVIDVEVRPGSSCPQFERSLPVVMIVIDHAGKYFRVDMDIAFYATSEAVRERRVQIGKLCRRREPG